MRLGELLPNQLLQSTSVVPILASIDTFRRCVAMGYRCAS